MVIPSQKMLCFSNKWGFSVNIFHIHSIVTMSVSAIVIGPHTHTNRNAERYGESLDVK